jgi:hypothetical protein
VVRRRVFVVTVDLSALAANGDASPRRSVTSMPSATSRRRPPRERTRSTRSRWRWRRKARTRRMSGYAIGSSRRAEAEVSGERGIGEPPERSRSTRGSPCSSRWRCSCSSSIPP